MSVDFEFRNKQRMWTYKGTPTYTALKKYFESDNSGNAKAVPLPKEYRMYPVNAFTVDCGNGCSIHIYDTSKYPTIKMSHFDHVERANAILQKAAAFFDCIVLNDLDHGDSEVWAGKPPNSKKPVKKSSGFHINIKPINLNLGMRLKNTKRGMREW
jgi:hypothetical protein